MKNINDLKEEKQNQLQSIDKEINEIVEQMRQLDARKNELIDARLRTVGGLQTISTIEEMGKEMKK